MQTNINPQKNILILGCGWLGKQMIPYFSNRNYQCYASSTNLTNAESIGSLGANSFVAAFGQENSPHLADSALKKIKDITFDAVVISVPVKRNDSLSQVQLKADQLVDFLTRINLKKIIHLSSIGIYKSKSGIINEESEVHKESGLFLMEETLRKAIPDGIFIRLGGLFGLNRIPGKYFSNSSTNLGEEHANYIHAVDAIQVLYKICESSSLEGTFNLVAPEHPLKKEVYEAMIKKYKIGPITYLPGNCIQKRVSSKKLIQALTFTYTYPNPTDF